MKLQQSIIGIIVLTLSTMFLITDFPFQLSIDLEKANKLMHFQNVGNVYATTDDDSGDNAESDNAESDNAESDNAESDNEEISTPNFLNPTDDGKSITEFDQSNFQPFSDLEVKNSDDESLSSNFIDPSNDGASTSTVDESIFQSLSDLLEVEPTTKTPSSPTDNEFVTSQIPNVESLGSDSNLGLKQLLPADSIIKGGIEKLGESLPPPINPSKPSKASCEARGDIFNEATGRCQSIR
jgi:hypothetical protein